MADRSSMPVAGRCTAEKPGVMSGNGRYFVRPRARCKNATKDPSGRCHLHRDGYNPRDAERRA